MNNQTNQTQSETTESTSIMASIPGPIQWAINMALYIVLGGLAYILSMIVLFALRGPIVAASGEGTFVIIFGAWVVLSFYLIGKAGRRYI